jgi:hypothetical protein
MMSKSLEISRNGKLLRIEACRQDVRLEFAEVVVCLLAYVEIIAPDGQIDAIPHVWECQGNLNALWPLIGRRMTKIVMDENSFRLTFEDGTLIRCKNRKAYDFVGVGVKDEKWETSYPTVLRSLRDK